VNQGVDCVEFCLRETEEIQGVSFRNDEGVVLGDGESISDGICEGVFFNDSASVLSLDIAEQTTLTSFFLRVTHIKNQNDFDELFLK